MDRTGYDKLEKADKDFTEHEKKLEKKKNNNEVHHDPDSTIQDMDYEDY